MKTVKPTILLRLTMVTSAVLGTAIASQNQSEAAWGGLETCYWMCDMQNDYYCKSDAYQTANIDEASCKTLYKVKDIIDCGTKYKRGSVGYNNCTACFKSLNDRLDWALLTCDARNRSCKRVCDCSWLPIYN